MLLHFYTLISKFLMYSCLYTSNSDTEIVHLFNAVKNYSILYHGILYTNTKLVNLQNVNVHRTVLRFKLYEYYIL